MTCFCLDPRTASKRFQQFLEIRMAVQVFSPCGVEVGCRVFRPQKILPPALGRREGIDLAVVGRFAALERLAVVVLGGVPVTVSDACSSRPARVGRTFNSRLMGHDGLLLDGGGRGGGKCRTCRSARNQYGKNELADLSPWVLTGSMRSVPSLHSQGESVSRPVGGQGTYGICRISTASTGGLPARMVCIGKVACIRPLVLGPAIHPVSRRSLP